MTNFLPPLLLMLASVQDINLVLIVMACLIPPLEKNKQEEMPLPMLSPIQSVAEEAV